MAYLKMETTANGVPYTWSLVSAQGAGFTLYPVTGIHGTAEIEAAKSALKKDRDVVGSIRVSRIDLQTTDEFLLARSRDGENLFIWFPPELGEAEASLLATKLNGAFGQTHTLHFGRAPIKPAPVEPEVTPDAAKTLAHLQQWGSTIPESERKKIIDELIADLGKPLILTFNTLGLKTHIEGTVVNPPTGQRFVLSFRLIDSDTPQTSKP